MIISKIAPYSWDRVLGLLNGAAYARAAKAQIYQGSSSFSSDRFVNAVLVAITGQPGYPEVMMDARRIDLSQRAHFEELLNSTVSAIGHGPREFADILDKIAAERVRNTAAVCRVFDGTMAAAKRMAGDLGVVIKSLAAVELASTVFVSATPVGLTFAGATAAAASSIGFGFGITKCLAKDFAEARGARVMALDLCREGGKHEAEERIERAADKVDAALGRKIEHHADLIAKAEQRIAQLSRQIRQRVSASKIVKLNRQIGREESAVASSESAIAKAQIGRFATRSLTVVFAAHDVYEAWEEFVEVWKSS